MLREFKVGTYDFRGLHQLKFEVVCGRSGGKFSVKWGTFCLFTVDCFWQLVGSLCVFYSRIASCEVAGILLNTVCAFLRVLFLFLTLAREAAFHIFQSEVAKLGLMAKLLTSVTLKWSTSTYILFYLYLR
jgi:hypothetical protein